MATTMKRDAVHAIFPVALAVLVFARSVSFAFVSWDDPLHLTENPLTAHPLAQGLGFLLRTPMLGYPVPLLELSYALDRAIFGLSPWAFHAENVLWHVANVLLVFRLAQALGVSARAAGAGAALFAVHPLVVEPVCWVTGRKDLVSTALVLAALCVIARAPDPRAVRTWAAASALAGLAMLAKPSAAAAPALLVITALSLERPARPRDAILRALPLAVLVAVLARVGAKGVEALGALSHRSALEAALDVTGALALHARHLVLPTGLVASYARDPGDPSVGSIVVTCVAVVAAGAATWWLGGRVARYGLAFAALAYAPAADLLGSNRWTADSYVYLPLVGVSIAVAAVGSRAARRFAGWGRVGVRAGAVTVPLALAAVASVQASRWSSSAELWAAVVKRYPAHPVPILSLARAFVIAGDLAAAGDAYALLDTADPSFDGALDERARYLALSGRDAAAMRLLVLGVREGKPPCVREYWGALFRSRSPPAASDRDTVARAFELGFPSMREGVDEPAVFDRVAVLLRAVGLEEDARQADARALELRAHRPR